MKPIHYITAALTMGASIAKAELPVVEIIDTTSISHEEQGTMNTPKGKVRVILRTFGTEKIAAAEDFGAHIGRGYSREDLDTICWDEGMKLYMDRFQAKAFTQYAEAAYATKIR